MSLSISEALSQAKKNKKGAFIPYFILGYPDLETSYRIITEASHHADIIELGIPFSDPVADGPTIQQGVTHALNQNISLPKIFEITKKLTSQLQTPFIYMIYFNQIYTYGMENFIKKMKEIGVRGLIVPDLLPDSEPEFNKIALSNGIDLIFLITPTTDNKRVPLILKESHGFIYFVAVIGITGERQNMNQQIKPMIESLKTKTNTPICVGFGISKSEHIDSVVQYCDGAIVGSAIVKKITENLDSPNLITTVTDMIKEMNSVLLRK